MSDPLPQAESWDRQPAEPNVWYTRFERYRLAGRSRSLLGTLNSEMLEKGLPRKTRILEIDPLYVRHHSPVLANLHRPSRLSGIPVRIPDLQRRTFTGTERITTMDNAPRLPEPWEQQPGEPNRWYARFERFRLTGPSRKRSKRDRKSTRLNSSHT